MQEGYSKRGLRCMAKETGCGRRSIPKKCPSKDRLRTGTDSSALRRTVERKGQWRTLLDSDAESCAEKYRETASLPKMEQRGKGQKRKSLPPQPCARTSGSPGSSVARADRSDR